MENRAGSFVKGGKRQQIATGKLHLGIRSKKIPMRLGKLWDELEKAVEFFFRNIKTTQIQTEIGSDSKALSAQG